MLIERGARDDEAKTFRQVGFDGLPGAAEATRQGGDALAVVVAEGEISDGEAPPGRIGGLSTAALIRKAREDDEIKALVLRVDSPGGSAFGCRAGAPRTGTHARGRQAGGGVDGRCGGLGRLLDRHRGRRGHRRRGHHHRLDRRVHAAAHGREARSTSWACTPAASPPPGWAAPSTRAARSTRASPRWCRAASTTPMPTSSPRWPRRASARRSRSTRWRRAASGPARRRKERGLVDRLGSYGDALKAAAQRGKLAGADSGDYRITYLEREPGRLQRLVEFFGGTVLEALARHIDGAWPVDRLAAGHGARDAARTALAGRADATAPALPAGGALPLRRSLRACRRGRS